MKVAIVGAGSVGATVGYACLLRGVADELVIYDLDAAKAEAQALDLAQGVQFAQMATVRHSVEAGRVRRVRRHRPHRRRPPEARPDPHGPGGGQRPHVPQLVPELMAGSPGALLLASPTPSTSCAGPRCGPAGCRRPG